MALLGSLLAAPKKRGYGRGTAISLGGSGSVNPELEAGKIYETPRGKMKWTALGDAR